MRPSAGTRPRVLVGCLFLEANSFAPGRTTRANFVTAGVLIGQQLTRAALPSGKELAAAWDALVDAGMSIVPSLFAWSPPGPRLTAGDFEAFAAEIVSRADATIDGVYLQLHGSMLAEGYDDPEGELLTRLRRRLRSGVPMAVSFDLHATMTRAIADAVDIVTAYRTCPHVDLERTGRQAGTLLAAAVMGDVRPTLAWAPLAMTTPPQHHDDAWPPFRHLMERCDEAESQPGVLSAVLLPSQPWLDVPDLGWSVVVTTDGDAELARVTAERIGLEAWQARASFLVPDAPSITEALAVALGGPVPYVVADAGDATNGGSEGDSTELLRAALDHSDRRIYLTITDPAAARTLRATPVGTTTTMILGSGPPGDWNEATQVEGVVLAHPDGRFRYSHPFSQGMAGDLGTCAVLGVGALRVVVHDRPVGVIDAEPYVGAGLRPEDAEVLQAKSHVSYRAGFARITERSIVAATPGPTTADLASLPWRRRARPLWPFEDPPWPWRDWPWRD